MNVTEKRVHRNEYIKLGINQDFNKDDLEEQRKYRQANRPQGIEKDRMNSRKKELEVKVQDGMLTHTQMWIPNQANVEQEVKWNRKYQNELDELKEINRRLEPDDPNAGRIEYLRKEGEADQHSWYGQR